MQSGSQSPPPLNSPNQASGERAAATPAPRLIWASEPEDTLVGLYHNGELARGDVWVGLLLHCDVSDEELSADIVAATRRHYARRKMLEASNGRAPTVADWIDLARERARREVPPPACCGGAEMWKTALKIGRTRTEYYCCQRCGRTEEKTSVRA